jgi:DNA-binding transcriptional regulator GbsR (MarR family)
MNNKDIWILTLNFLFERATSLIHQKNKQVAKVIDLNVENLTKEELRNFIEEENKQIEELCKLINYVYKYQHRKENPFEN